MNDFLIDVINNTRLTYSMIYPFHIDKSKVKNKFINLSKYSYYNFNDVVRIAKLEPFAFYLTNEDKIFYTVKEVNLLEEIKINSSYDLESADIK